VTVLLALAGFYAAMMLVRYGRRGLLAVAPTLVRSRPVPDGRMPTEPQRKAGDLLAPLGFVPHGHRDEEGPLGGLGLRSASWADGEAVFADLFEQGPRPGDLARVQLLTTFPDGVAALTANHVRKARAGPGGEVEGLPGTALAQVVEIHRRTVARLAEAHGSPLPARDLAGRDAAARTWYRGIGGEELRARFAVYLGNALVAAGILTFCVVAIWRSRAAR
jgi:hypothetical protein